MNKSTFLCPLLLALTVAVALPLYAGGPGLSGAIFTTLPDGSEVNFNIYSDKTLVYLDGGPPVGAPAGAAGLPGPGSTVFGTTISGTYVFQVTDPPGKTQLSTDAAQCREFTVDSNGVINGVTGPCPHAFSFNTNTQAGGTTVQLFPFDDTPNKGGEYKVWVTPIEFFGCSLSAIGPARTSPASAAAVPALRCWRAPISEAMRLPDTVCPRPRGWAMNAAITSSPSSRNGFAPSLNWCSYRDFTGPPGDRGGATVPAQWGASHRVIPYGRPPRPVGIGKHPMRSARERR